MTDKRAYFHVDVGYLSNPKIAAMLDDHPRAILLHLQCIAYSAQHLTDGVVPMRLAMRLACAEQCDLDLLLQCGLLVRVSDTSVAVHDYLEHQRSADKVKSASDKGKQAAAARWGNPPSDAVSNAPSMPAALPDPMPRKREERDSKRVREASRFSEFWAAFPLKKGKQAAERNYNAAVRRGASEQQMIDGALAYAKSVEGVDPTKIKYPQGWITDGRYEDELEPTLAAKSSAPFTPPLPPVDMPDDLYRAWNVAHAAAYRENRPGPTDWHQLREAS